MSEKITIITMQLKTPGGIERFVSTIATMFSADKEVEIVANYGSYNDPLTFPIPKNIKITFLTKNKPKEISLKKLITKLQWHKIPSEFKRRRHIHQEQNQVFKKYLKNLQTDFIITERALYNKLVNKYYIGNAKKIATDHNFHQNNPRYINELISSLKNFDALVVATDELKNFYANKIGNTKCFSIPNPLPDIPSKKSSLKNPNLLAIGRLVPEKNFSTLLDVIYHIKSQKPNINLTIIGDGPEKSLLQEKVKNLHLENNITMTGWLSQDEIKKYYYNSCLFVMTSKTEAFGLVLAEAMSYGVPCVAFSRASGARAQITNSNGVLIKDNSPITMANKIIKLLEHPETIKKYQDNINKTIQQYSTENIKKLWAHYIFKK